MDRKEPLNHNNITKEDLDITEREHAEKALRDSKIQFRSLFDSVLDGILIADIETKKFIDANPSMLNMIGYELEELMKLGLEDIHPKADLANVLEHFARQSKGDEEIARNLPVLRKDGSIFYADICSSPFQHDNKTCMAGFFRDITERKKIEQEKEQLIADLHKAYLEVKTLKGILPLCSYCKKIRSDNNEWIGVDSYKHSEADVSHSICPDCAKKHHPDEFEDFYPHE